MFARAAMIHGPTRAKLIRSAIDELASFESSHPVPFAPDQRVAAVAEIVRRRLGVDALPGRFLASIKDALR